MCLNTIHTGSGMKAAPKAKIDDGLMDIIILKKTPSCRLLLLLPKIFTGEHVHSSYIDYVQAKTLCIKPDKNEMLNIDGENKFNTPISITVLPKKISILY